MSAGTSPDDDGTESTRPLLRVVSGDPTPEELAALIAVVAARGSAPADKPATPRSEWNHPVRALRGEHRAGPGVWRASSFTR